MRVFPALLPISVELPLPPLRVALLGRTGTEQVRFQGNVTFARQVGIARLVRQLRLLPLQAHISLLLVVVVYKTLFCALRDPIAFSVPRCQLPA